MVLERNAPFPSDVSDDRLLRPTIEVAKRRAATMAALQGDGTDIDMEERVWVYSEPAAPFSGERVPPYMLADEYQVVNLGDKGVALRDGYETFIERIPVSGLEDWRRRRGETSADIRLLGDHRDSSGRRRLPLGDAVPLLRSTDFEDWPLTGLRAFQEFVVSVLAGPGNFISYHSELERTSGVSPHSSICHDHKILCDVMRLALEVDQVDGSNLASLEQVCRRVIQ